MSAHRAVYRYLHYRALLLAVNCATGYQLPDIATTVRSAEPPRQQDAGGSSRGRCAPLDQSRCRLSADHQPFMRAEHETAARPLRASSCRFPRAGRARAAAAGPRTASRLQATCRSGWVRLTHVSRRAPRDRSSASRRASNFENACYPALGRHLHGVRCGEYCSV